MRNGSSRLNARIPRGNEIYIRIQETGSWFIVYNNFLVLSTFYFVCES